MRLSIAPSPSTTRELALVTKRPRGQENREEGTTIVLRSRTRTLWRRRPRCSPHLTARARPTWTRGRPGWSLPRPVHGGRRPAVRRGPHPVAARRAIRPCSIFLNCVADLHWTTGHGRP